MNYFKLSIFLTSFIASCFLLAIRNTDMREVLDTILPSFIFENIGLIHNVLVFAPIILFFSSIMYFFPKRYFMFWWRFARITIPAILILVILINLQFHHAPGGWFNIDHAVDRVFTGLLFAIFTLGSLIQLLRGYWAK